MELRKERRITVGQKAAVHALILAGQSMTVAMQIVDMPRQLSRVYFAPDWRVKTQPRRRWTDDLLAEVQEAYLDRNQKVTTIAERYGVSDHMIHFLAEKHGWKRRPHGPPRNPRSTCAMSREQLTWYIKMRDVLGAATAKELVWATQKGGRDNPSGAP